MYTDMLHFWHTKELIIQTHFILWAVRAGWESVDLTDFENRRWLRWC